MTPLSRRLALFVVFTLAAAGCQKREETTPAASTDTMGGAEAAVAGTPNPLRNAYFG